ncbi:MAG: hypothetical protein DRJ98_07015 [Thermoprotei archaeon]|nr:MAG: hypothetical protein DRJ98_07015 [Thermoprotei archaeon]
MSKFLEAVSKWLGRAGRGPKLEVPLYKLVLLLRVVEEEGPIGRYALVEKVRLGEGIVKALLASLTAKGLLRPHRGKGCTLTEVGKEELSHLLSEWGVVSIKLLEGSWLSLGKYEVAVQIRGAAGKVRLGIEQRDEAVKVGAKGALTLTCSGEKLLIPGVNEALEKTNPMLAKKLSSIFNLKDEDVVLICSADDRWLAEEAALAISFKLRPSQG